jgi:hypothetical protein
MQDGNGHPPQNTRSDETGREYLQRLADSLASGRSDYPVYLFRAISLLLNHAETFAQVEDPEKYVDDNLYPH